MREVSTRYLFVPIIRLFKCAQMNTSFNRNGTIDYRNASAPRDNRD